MLPRIALLLGLASAVLASADTGPQDEAAAADTRDGRFWWPAWWGTDCTTTSGWSGSCFKAFECKKRGGNTDGTCGTDAAGLCCDLHPFGDTDIDESGEYFANKGHPDTYNRDETTTANLMPPSGTVQVRLDFEDFKLTPPVEGECTNDTFVFEGANPGSEIPVLCGFNSGQHMYIDVDNSEGPWKLIVKTTDADYARSWKIKVTFITLSSMMRAPFRCLQFYPEEAGQMMSFNYNPDGDSMMLNNQMYSICFGYLKGYCDIGITLPRFDLGPIDSAPDCEDRYLRAGYTAYCGDFTDISITVNVTAPAILTVSADDDNAIEEEGFIADYMRMKCV